ncbi:MAG TPA: YsnF/AvaK domain-containing protein [Nitrososphaeraceae archaeon]|jgi:uncharacterized protein (TIGR02271 family)|nr:YsnF/AvaK domain-containing protein [Nitrososphaeraceae archaeon]
MSKLKDKIKDKVSGAGGTEGGQTSEYEEGAPGTETGRKEDPLKSYREKEAMTPAKIKEHEPTAVRRDPSDQKIVEPGRTGTNPEEAAEIARKKGMAKGMAGAAETGSEYEQGAAGTYASGTSSGGTNREESSENVRSENVRSDTDDTTIPVVEEDLEVSKRESTRGEARITKEPITETKEVEVPVTHEEAVIERRPASGNTVASSETRTEVDVPLKSEEVEVTKQPYVKEEVSVKKKPVTETQKVREEVTSEQVNVEGNIREE